MPTQAQEILERTRDVISASVYGVLVIAFIQGTLGGIAFWALGLPSPLLWGVVMLLLSMIPMAGVVHRVGSGGDFSRGQRGVGKGRRAQRLGHARHRLD